MHRDRGRVIDPSECGGKIKLRILHTESSWGWGGQELRILTESSALIARGHSVAIAGLRDTPLLRAAAEQGIETLPLPIRKKRLTGILAIRKLLKSRKFDVVNTHSSTDAWLTALACATLSRPPKIVRTRHVSTFVKPTVANRWLFNRACASVITTGKAVRDMLIRDLGIDPTKIISVPTGVDSEYYRPVGRERKIQLRQLLGLPQETIIVGTVATLRFLKGIEYLFAAVQLLNNTDIRVCVVGDGPQQQRLRDWIHVHNMQDQILMVGEQSNVNEWLQSFDIFAFPSLAEGVPQALTQAMLTELPCVTTNVGGIPELAIHGKTALLCESQNAYDLMRGIQLLLKNPSLQKTLGVASRQHCIASRSVSGMASAMERIFISQMERSAHARGGS